MNNLNCVLGFLTFWKRCDSVAGLFHVGAVWGFEDTAEGNSSQSRAMRCFLWVHEYTAMGADGGGTEWDSSCTKMWNGCVVEQSHSDVRREAQLYSNNVSAVFSLAHTGKNWCELL